MADIRVDMKTMQRMDAFEASELLMLWAPRVYFHPSEKWFPMDMDVYVNNCHGLDGDGAPVPGAEAGTLTWERLADMEDAGDKSVRRLDIDDGWLAANESKMNNLGLYGIAGRMADGNIMLCYPMFYADNPAVPVALLFGAGAHKADLEFVYFLLDPTGKELHWAYMTAHGTLEHSWVPASKMLYDRLTRLEAGRTFLRAGERPSIFVAYNSHAVYWQPGTHWRVFGFTADICSSSGPVLDFASPNLLRIMNLDADPIFKYTGRMGPDGVGSFRGGRLSISLLRTHHSASGPGRRIFLDMVSPEVGFFAFGLVAACMMSGAALYAYITFVQPKCDA